MTGAYALKDVRADKIEVVCDRCARHGVYTVTDLVARFGADTVVPEVLRQIIIEGSCPRVEDYSDICGAKFSMQTVRAYTKPENLDYVRKILSE